MIARRLSRARRRDGQALVELALVLPIFMLLLFGVFDMGRAVFAYNTLGEAARAGVRVAVVNQIQSSPDCQDDRPIIDPSSPHWSIKQCAVSAALNLGLSESDVTVAYVDPPNTDVVCSPTLHVGCIARVTVTTVFHPITPVINRIVGDINLENTSEMPVERLFP